MSGDHPAKSGRVDSLVKSEKVARVVALAIGFLFALATYLLGEYITTNILLSLPSGPSVTAELVVFSVLFAIVVGDVVGRALRKRDRTLVLFASYFASFLGITGFIFAFDLLYVPIVLIAACLALAELFDLLRVDRLEGSIFKWVRNFSLLLIDGGVNYTFLQPTLNVYVGGVSYISWLIVILPALYVLNIIREPINRMIGSKPNETSMEGKEESQNRAVRTVVSRLPNAFWGKDFVKQLVESGKFTKEEAEIELRKLVRSNYFGEIQNQPGAYQKLGDSR